MDWNKILISTTIWFVQVIRFIGVLAFMGFLYFYIFEGHQPELALDLGSDHDLLIDKEQFVFNDTPEEVISDLEIRSKGYLVNLTIEGKWKAPYLCIFLLFIGIYYWLATVLLRLVVSGKEGGFFNVKNVLRLRIIGFALLSIEPLSWLYSYLSEWYLKDIINLKLYNSGKTINIGTELVSSPILIGLLVLIIAQAFNHGLKLKEEQELTI